MGALSFGPKVKGLLRPYGGIGGTFVDVDGSKLTYRGGVQGLFLFEDQFAYLGFGMDIGYSHLYETTSPTGNTSSDYINTLAIVEIKLYYSSFQVGIGHYFDVGGVKETEFSVMVAGGLSIPLNMLILSGDVKYISIPLMIRADFILADQTATSLSFFTGLTFYFP